MNLNSLKKSRLLHLNFAILFFTSGIIVNLVQGFLYITLRPFNKILYRKINWYLCYLIYSQLLFLGDWWSGSDVVLYVDREEFDKYYGKEHSLCVMNHTYEVDWVVGWMICDRISLLGNAKSYCKKVIQYLPVLGWGWKFSEFVFLERSFDKDKEIINKQIRELAEHPDPMWLLLFPEGTRFSPSKHEASVEFARKNNLPELKHHLIPRTKGFIASLPSMRGKVPALYDIEVAFKDDDPVKPTITNLLLGRRIVSHVYMKRIPLDTLPHTDAELDNYMKELFIVRDRMKESFIKTGDFFATSGVPRVEPFVLPRRCYSAIWLLFWAVTILIPMWYWLISLFFSGQILYFSIGAGILGLFALLLNKMIGMSEIKKGSSYGASTPKKSN